MTRASEAALHLVGDEQRARAIAAALDGGGERRRQRTHAALSLNRLEHDGGRLAVTAASSDAGSAGHERDVGQQRRERIAVVRVRRDRQRPHRAAVERPRRAPRIRCAAARPPCTSSGARTSGTPPWLPCRCCRRTSGRVPTASRAARPARPGTDGRTGSTSAPASPPARQRLAPGRVGVPERGHADARDEVEVVRALGVPHTRALPAHQDDRRAPVDLQHVPRLEGSRS